MTNEPIKLSIEAGVATICLNRPESLNGIDLGLAGALLDAFTRVDGQPEVKCLFIKGEGRAFSVGGDLRVLEAYPDPHRPGALRALVAAYNSAILRLSELKVPVVAAVHGSVAGGALGLVCAADVVVAADSTTFTCAYSKLGLTADGGVSWYLPRLVGLRKAQELLLLSPQFSAREALAWGLVTSTCPEAELDAVARGLTETIAGQSTTASTALRKLIAAGTTHSLNAHLDAETESMAQAASTPIFNHRIHEFVRARPNSRGPAPTERPDHADDA